MPPHLTNEPLTASGLNYCLPWQSLTTTTSDCTISVNNEASLTLDVDILGRKVRMELDKILDKYFRNIYRVIGEHFTPDISEEEFIKLIKEEKDE